MADIADNVLAILTAVESLSTGVATLNTSVTTLSTTVTTLGTPTVDFTPVLTAIAGVSELLNPTAAPTA